MTAKREVYILYIQYFDKINDVQLLNPQIWDFQKIIIPSPLTEVIKCTGL